MRNTSSPKVVVYCTVCGERMLVDKNKDTAQNIHGVCARKHTEFLRTDEMKHKRRQGETI